MNHDPRPPPAGLSAYYPLLESRPAAQVLSRHPRCSRPSTVRFKLGADAVRLGERLVLAVHADAVRRVLLPVQRRRHRPPRPARGPAVQLLRRAFDQVRLRPRVQLPGVFHGFPQVC